MADIISPEAIRFCNEVVRPLAEQVRSLKAVIDSTLITWNAGVGAIIGTSAADAIQDGRETEGVSRLTAADVAAFGAQLILMQTQLNQAGVAEAVSKPCVRQML
jgi:hypothetical protein